MSEWLKVIYLGLIEGFTEFIPVSSTGHLILTEHLLELNSANTESFSVFIQLGAILAVVFLYWPRFIALIPTTQQSHALAGVRGVLTLFVACLPAFVFGALFHSKIKAYLFGPTTVAWALIVGGILFLVVERRKVAAPDSEQVTLEALTLTQAFRIGLWQCLALWPGMSRSGSTIIGGMLSGLGRKEAAEFSFLLAVPVMVAAVGYDLLKSADALSQDDLKVFAIGFIVSFFTALIAIKFFIALLGRWTLVPFAWYRILLGILVLTLL